MEDHHWSSQGWNSAVEPEEEEEEFHNLHIQLIKTCFFDNFNNLVCSEL
jgi:hypothetical protein